MERSVRYSYFAHGVVVTVFALFVLALAWLVMIAPEKSSVRQYEALRVCQQMHFKGGRLDDRWRVVCDDWDGREVRVGETR